MSRSSLPKLRWNDGEWSAAIVLPAWKGFQSRTGAYNARGSKRPSTGQARLRVLTADDQRTPPMPAQERAYAHLTENQASLRDVMLKAILPAYAKLRRAWGDFELLVLPGQQPPPRKFSSVDQVKSHIGLASIYILPDAKNGYAYVGYGFGCSWDEEHGLGVAMHRNRVLEVGGEDAAFRPDVVDSERRSAAKARGPLVPRDLKFEDLNRAVLEGNKPWVKALLDAGAVPDKRYLGPGTSTALAMAVAYNQAAILEMLLPKARRPLTKDLMRMAAYVGYKKIVKILAQHGLEPPTDD